MATAVALMTVDVGLAADSGIDTAALQVNGATVANYNAPPATQDVVWQPSWTPAGTGVYTLTVDITAMNGVTATSPAIIVYVDTANPSVSVTNEAITQATLRDDGVYGLRGTASDDSAIATVEVQIDGGAWQEAALSGGDWLLEIAPLADVDPDGGTLAIAVQATDMAGRTATTSANFTLDVVPPEMFTITTSLTSGEPISPTLMTTGLDSRISWPDVAGAANLYVGWTAVPTPTLGSLAMLGAGAGSQDTMQAEATAMYAHVVAVDVNGNATAVASGPFYFDSAETPDLVSDLALTNWTESGSKQVGQMNGTNFGEQKLFAGWNANDLRLRWQGMNVDGDGDLYLYLGTGGADTMSLLNPFGADPADMLPFVADYVVHVSDSLTATLYTVSGGVWTVDGAVAVTAVDQTSDILLPFAGLGIGNPASTSLKLLGVASAENTLDVWATVPDENLERPSWTQYIEWASSGSGVVPADGVWADARLETAVAAHPAPTALVGAGDTITLTLTYSNTGRAALPLLTFAGTASGGLAMGGAQTAVNIPSGGTGTLTLLGTVSSSGAVALTLADSYHRPYALETFTYTMDITPPQNVTVTLDFVGTLTNTIIAVGEDDSPLGLVEVEVDDGLLATQGMQIVACVPGSGAGNAFVCDWNAGVVTDGQSYTMRARAADVHGNVSPWSDPVIVIGDATLPTLDISVDTQAALSDGQLNSAEMTLDGMLVDERTAVSVQACLTEIVSGEAVESCATTAVLPDNSWSLSLPGNYDGVTATLSIVGYDGAGNPSNSFTQAVWLDTVAPVIDEFVTPEVVQAVGSDGVLFASGTVTDTSGLTAVRVIMIQPDGSSVLVDGTVNGNAWAVSTIFTQRGDYQAVALLTDGAGNRRFSEVWAFTQSADSLFLPLVMTPGQANLTVTAPANLQEGIPFLLP